MKTRFQVWFHFLVSPSNRDSYSRNLDIQNQVVKINNKSLLNSSIRSQIYIESSVLSGSENYSDERYISSYVWGEENKNRSDEGNSTENKNSTVIQNYKHLWVQCESCYLPNYKRFLNSQIFICEYCAYHMKMSSSERIELSIDSGTWDPMDEDMVSLDPIQWDLERPCPPEIPCTFEIQCPPEISDRPYPEEIPYPSKEAPSKDLIEWDIQGDSDQIDQIARDSDQIDSGGEDEPYQIKVDSYRRETGLNEAVQTGTGQLNGIPVAIGVMDFQFMGGSMGSVVGEKITRLIEYATNNFLPLILVCASGGARMQEGSLSLMQMAKIASALYDYQSNKKLFYVSILTSPTTGGVTASFAMLGDIIIAEPDAYIAFAGKRVIEQTLNITVPEGSQVAEFLFDKGLFDLIVPRKDLKGVLNELFQLHAISPFESKSF